MEEQVKKSKYELAHELRMTELFFELISDSEVTEFTADDVRKKFNKEKIPPLLIGKCIGNLIRSFYRQGYIKKTDKFILSSHCSRCLPIYSVVKIKAE